MRTWGRLWERDNAGQVIPGTTPVWGKVETSPEGFDDNVYLTAMAQEFQLNINESPFFGDRGVPAHQSVMQQIFPDWYVWKIQRLYAPKFSSLTMSRVPDLTTPTYDVLVITNQGAPV